MHDTTSLLKKIEKELGEEIHRKVEEISYDASIYILYLVDIIEVTEKALRVGFASYQAKWPDRTFEMYMRHKRDWKEDRYSYVIEPQGYFIDAATAVDYAEKNMGDINEAGAYPYVIVSSMPLNRVYPMCNTRDHRIFKFNRNKEIYEEIDWDYNDGTKILLEKGESGAF